MGVTSKTLSAATLSVAYITAGSLILIWSSVYYVYLYNHGQLSDSGSYWCYGFMLTGIVVGIIGVLVGRIGASARPAEVAAPEAGAPAPEQTVAQNGVAANGAVPVVMMPVGQQPVVPAQNGNGATAPAPMAAPAIPPR